MSYHIFPSLNPVFVFKKLREIIQRNPQLRILIGLMISMSFVKDI